MKKLNDLSQLASLKEKMELEDQEYYSQKRKEAQFADEFFEDQLDDKFDDLLDYEMHHDPTAFARDPEEGLEDKGYSSGQNNSYPDYKWDKQKSY